MGACDLRFVGQRRVIVQLPVSLFLRVELESDALETFGQNDPPGRLIGAALLTLAHTFYATASPPLTCFSPSSRYRSASFSSTLAFGGGALGLTRAAPPFSASSWAATPVAKYWATFRLAFAPEVLYSCPFVKFVGLFPSVSKIRIVQGSGP